jgi:hypothetical protein
VTNREDPITELIAKAVVNVVATGERNPDLAEQRALNALGYSVRMRAQFTNLSQHAPICARRR